MAFTAVKFMAFFWFLGQMNGDFFTFITEDSADLVQLLEVLPDLVRPPEAPGLVQLVDQVLGTCIYRFYMYMYVYMYVIYVCM